MTQKKTKDQCLKEAQENLSSRSNLNRGIYKCQRGLFPHLNPMLTRSALLASKSLIQQQLGFQSPPWFH